MIVKSQVLKLPEPFIMEKGGVIKEAIVAYEEYGKKEGPTVLITHGGLSSHHAAGRYSAQDPLPGFWDDLIGPEKAIDTNRYRVLSANSLGRDVQDYEKGVQRIKCPVLLINISTDSEFPPYWAEELAGILNKNNPNQAQVKIIDSPWGHMGCVQEGKAIGKHIMDFLCR